MTCRPLCAEAARLFARTSLEIQPLYHHAWSSPAPAFCADVRSMSMLGGPGRLLVRRCGMTDANRRNIFGLRLDILHILTHTCRNSTKCCLACWRLLSACLPVPEASERPCWGFTLPFRWLLDCAAKAGSSATIGQPLSPMGRSGWCSWPRRNRYPGWQLGYQKAWQLTDCEAVARLSTPEPGSQVCSLAPNCWRKKSASPEKRGKAQTRNRRRPSRRLSVAVGLRSMLQVRGSTAPAWRARRHCPGASSWNSSVADGPCGRAPRAAILRPHPAAWR